MLIKNGESKLEDYATQTLTDISTYFLQLHGLLQVEELRITESLRAKSLRPQNKLRNTAQKLNNYESDLLKMRHNLDSYKLNLPHGVHLKDVIMHCYTYLETIPTELQLSLDTNPFVFEALAEDKLMQIIRQHIKHDCIDPKAWLQCSYNADLWRSSSECALRETPRTALNTWLPHNTAATPQRDSQKDSCTGETQQLSTLNPSDAICITHVNTPESFYVRTDRSSKRMRELSDKWQNAAAMRVVLNKSFRLGQKYLIYHQLDKLWFRVEIKEIVKPDVFIVFLVDLGKYKKVKTSGLYELDYKDAEIRPGAIHCSLQDIMPSKKKWTDEANRLLLELTCNRPVRLKYALRAGCSYIIDLAVDNYASTVSVRDAFLYSGLALERSGNTPIQLQADPKTKFQGTASRHQRLSKRSLLPGELLNVTLIHIKNPNEFYVMQHELMSERVDLTAQLNKFFKTSVDDGRLEHIYVGAIDMGCAICVKHTWHRARIQEILCAGKVIVQLVDHGRSHTAHWRELYVLPTQFFTKEFSFKCALADVEPLQCNTTWPEKSIAKFKQLASKSKLELQIVNTLGDTHYVALRVIGKRDKVNIGAMLVKLGHATSIEGCSLLPYEKPKGEQQSGSYCNLNVEAVLTSRQTTCRAINFAATSMENSDNVAEFEPIATQLPLKGTPVLITHVIDHSEFYVRLSSFEKDFRMFENRLQKFANDQSRTSMHQEKLWQEHESCLVKACIGQNHASPTGKWYRGNITAVVQTVSECTTYNVFLCDYGITIVGANVGMLLESTCELDQTASAAQHCQLAGLTTLDGGVLWTKLSENYFKSQLSADSTQTYEVTIVERIGYSISVILWSVKLEVGDPLGPATRRCENINKCIATAGFAIYIPPIEEEVLAGGKGSLQLPNITYESMINNTMSVAADDELSTANSSTSELEEALNQLNDAACTLTKILPVAWLKQRPQNKTMFTAKPTYVDFNAVVYANLPADLDLLNKMKDKLEQIYAPIFNSRRHTNDMFVPEQPCVVIHNWNKKNYYRGIVQSYNQSEKNYRVYFVDYGNMEDVSTRFLIPYAPLPSVHSMALPLRIHGIIPKRVGEGFGYSAEAVDIMHRNLVDKLVSVTVREETPESSKIRECDIHISSNSIADILVQLGYAMRKKPTKKLTKRAHCVPAAPIRKYGDLSEEHPSLPDFEMNIDDQSMEKEIDLFNNMNSGGSMELSPPTKRLMYALSWIEFLDERQEVQIQELPPTRTDVRYNGDCDGIGIQAAVDLKNDSNAVSKDSEFDEYFLAQEPVRNQFYQQLENKTDFDQFCPLDTSTVFSLFDGVGHIKPQKLPTGVFEFKCSIDRIVSPTELQIFPHIKELQKRDTAMRRKIVQLVKDTPDLIICEPNTLCLAQYTRDRKWYRAIVRTFNPRQRTAVVLYIDYLNSEELPLRKLKQMPEELVAWPLRSLRVKLHNIKPNPCIRKCEARKALRRCILEPPAVLYSRVKQMPECDSSLSDEDNYNCNAEALYAPAGKAARIITVELYERASSTVPIYQTLIDKKQYINDDDFSMIELN